MAWRIARHSEISSVPSNRGSVSASASSGRPASRAAIAVSAAVSGEAASFGSCSCRQMQQAFGLDGEAERQEAFRREVIFVAPKPRR